MSKSRILFVCMGNICRSPTAEGVLRHLVATRGLGANIEIDSAGTHAYHVGSPPDPRAQAHAAKRGYDLSKLKARRVREGDFTAFDVVLAMDDENIGALERICPPEHRSKVGLLMRYARRHAVREVPDPYYGGPNGFEVVLDYIEDACEGLLDAALTSPRST